MPSTAKRTRYASDADGMVCLLLDIRGRANQHNLHVWSYAKGCVVNLPYRYRTGKMAGRALTTILTPEAKRWGAVLVPRWLANDRGLHAKPPLPPIVPEFCRQRTVDTRTAQERRDDGERALAEYVVSRQNKYRKMPSQIWGASKRDHALGKAAQ
jgi:hypothetical protein